MIKQHTAKSLARYLGQRVMHRSFEGQELICDLIGIDSDGWIKCGGLDRFCTLKDPKTGIEFDGIDRDKVFITMPKNVYPILKTYEQLVEPTDSIEFVAKQYWGRNIFPKLTSKKEEFLPPILRNLPPRKYAYFTFNDFEIWINDDFVFGEPHSLTDEITFNTNYNAIEALLDLGFGAIPNPESPTGYVDLFGYPCVGEE